MVFIAVAGGVWCWLLPDSHHRLAFVTDQEPEQPKLSLPVLLSIFWPLAGLGFFGLLGLIIGIATVPFVRSWLTKLESAADRRHAAAISADLPVALSLIGAAVTAGRSTESALSLVANHLSGPLGTELQSVARQLMCIPDPRLVWRNLDSPVLNNVARTFARSSDSGSSIVLAVARAAEDVRKERQETKKIAASRVAVKTAAPLGVCFLPAFLLVGIVPMILGVSVGVFGS